MSTLGKTLKRLRAKKKMTQEDLAKEMGTTRATVANWEVDRAVPDAYTLQQIADIFHISLDQLLGRVDSTPKLNAHIAESREAARYGETYTLPLLDILLSDEALFDPKNIADYVEVPPSFAKADYFALTIKNNAMAWAGLEQDTMLIVHHTQSVTPGSIVAVCQQQHEPIISVGFYLQDHHQPILRFAHPAYQDIALQETDRILGCIVHILRRPPSFQTYQELMDQEQNNPQEWFSIMQKSNELGLNKMQLQQALEYISHIRKL